MKRIVSLIWLAALALMLTSCSNGNSSSISVPAIPNISGAWEFSAISSSGTKTGIEVALQEGKNLVNGMYVADGNISASDLQISFVTFDPSTGFANGFGGYCTTSGGTATNSLSGAISALGGAVTNFTYTENGNVFNVTATLSGDGKSMQGTYQSTSPSNCPDTGTFLGTVVSKLSGNYTGTVTLPSCASPGCDTANATLSGSALSLILSGTDNSTLSLTGQVTGNAFSMQGTFQGQTVVFDGYYELTYNSLDQLNDLPSLYIVDVTNPAQPASVGLLTVPQS